MFPCLQWLHLGIVLADVGPEKHPEQYYVARWVSRYSTVKYSTVQYRWVQISHEGNNIFSFLFPD